MAVTQHPPHPTPPTSPHPLLMSSTEADVRVSVTTSTQAARLRLLFLTDLVLTFPSSSPLPPPPFITPAGQIRVPLPPTNVHACEVSNTYVVLSWTEPEPRGREPLSFYVERVSL